MKQKQQKAVYVAPSIEVIEMENEGVIAGSNTSNSIPGFGNGGAIGISSRTRGYNSASSSDLEDIINDILTVEN